MAQRLPPPPWLQKEFNYDWRQWLHALYNEVVDVSDYNLEVLQGNVPGHSMVSISGHDDSVPNGGPYGLSPTYGAGSYSFDQSAIAATPAIVSVASTDNTNDIAAGTGALTVKIIGLDALGVAATEDVTMTGTTKADTTATWSAVHSVIVLTTGASNGNTGIIHVGTGTFTAGVPAVRMLSIQIHANRSLSGYYVVPAGKTLYLRSQVLTVEGSKTAEVFIETSPDGILWTRGTEFAVGNGDVSAPINAVAGIPAGTHIQIEAAGTSAGTAVTAIIAAELVNN